ncbi:MAG TPA: glycosyltransferase family 4 protein [Pyrinomonadaceae bacterium]|nr:glycosyltransferase family 4 protein [Pyrinomonadaceae bacterium]
MRVILCKGQVFESISGADEILVNYATHLHRSGHSVTVLLLYPCSPQNEYYVRLRECGVRVEAIAPTSAGTFLGVGRKITSGLLNTFPASRYLVRRHAQKVTTNIASGYYEQCRNFFERSGAHLAHAITPDPGAMVMISAAHAARVPVLYQEVGTPYHPPEYEKYYEQFTTVLPLCAEVAALSPSLARQCREKLPNRYRQLSVLPIMIEEMNGHHAAEERGPSADVRIGFAARIEHLKGPMVLLEAFAAASRTSDRLRLMIAGAGTLEQKIAARARELGVAARCEFLGVYLRPEERQSFMQSLDIFALPSLTEGTPNSIIEAMSHGLPVVASTVGGIPDMITPDTGLLVPPNDAASLAEALTVLARDARLREQMGRAAKERYRKLFSPGVVLPVLLNTYRRISVSGVAARTPPPDAAHPWAQDVACLTV